jgi:carbonic anhydrase
LCSFILILLLVNSFSSTGLTFNKKKLTAFLQKLEPKTSYEQINNTLDNIIQPINKPKHKSKKTKVNKDKHSSPSSRSIWSKSGTSRSLDLALDKLELKEKKSSKNKHNKNKTHYNQFLQTSEKKHHKKSQNEKSNNSKENENIQLTKKFLMEEAEKSTLLEGWLNVSSKTFSDSLVFPPLYDPNGETLRYHVDGTKLINNNFVSKITKVTEPTDKTVKVLDKYYFWFRLTNKYLYYTNDEKNINILGSIPVPTIYQVLNQFDEDHCLSLDNKKGETFTLCAQDSNSTINWTCYLNMIMTGKSIDVCKIGFKKVELPAPRKIIKRILKQPFIIIPTPQRMCNDGWNYEKKGIDWECLCKEGKEQSPIDLPVSDSAIQSPAKPLFDYEYRIPNLGGTKLKIEHLDETLRIKGHGFGRIVTMDGSIYQAEEIIFHTPSEHTLNGVQYPLEIQVVHDAKTKGDFGKKAALSFLFTGKPGIYNKFLDQVEFFNLPNPLEKFKVIQNNLFIPNLLMKADEEEVMIMQPFSFFTYNGSMSSPPCIENTIHFVVSKPIELSITVLELFKEALRMPDFEDSQGNILLSEEKTLENARGVQALNGRAIFHYDHNTYNCPTFKKKIEFPTDEPKEVGHYEKQENVIENYMFVDGLTPSGIPGAMVVDEREAK